jgi:hypothetical protein
MELGSQIDMRQYDGSAFDGTFDRNGFGDVLRMCCTDTMSLTVVGCTDWAKFIIPRKRISDVKGPGEFMKSLLQVTFIFSSLLMFAPAVNADFCVVPGVEEGVQRATLVFSGKIVSISRAQANNDNSATSNSEFVVKFEVEAWWKGAGNLEMQVLWRTDIVGCSYFPIGEIGERYLVYADPSKRTVAGEEHLLEVTIFNRTSKIPANTRAVNQFDGETQRKRPVLLEMAELNRLDASVDIQISLVKGVRLLGVRLSSMHGLIRELTGRTE